MDSVCRLCSNPADLCRSHILPEFLYRPLYDEKHRFFVVTAAGRPDRYAQRGLTEKLLCHTCEQHFCRHERYAADVMTGRMGHRYRKRDDRMVIKEIDYTQFKLFQMSLLWRASVSSLEFFRLVSLGPHEERLRTMLLQDDPGEPEDFGCVVVFARESGQGVSDTFFNPEPLRWSGRRMYRFFFAGSAWLFHCDRQTPALHLQKFLLQRDGSLTGLLGDLAEAKAYGPRVKRLARTAGY